MNSKRFTRYFAMPIVAAGIIGGALGLAGAANAANNADVRPPDVAATPDTKAHPAPVVMPGQYWHHGIHKIEVLQPGYIR
jgi:hypothetical protein